MDGAALSLCNDNHLPIVVFDLETPGQILAVTRGERRGTLVHDLPGKAESIWAEA
jgi:uridylate kinase